MSQHCKHEIEKRIWSHTVTKSDYNDASSLNTTVHITLYTDNILHIYTYFLFVNILTRR